MASVMLIALLLVLLGTVFCSVLVTLAFLRRRRPPMVRCAACRGDVLLPALFCPHCGRALEGETPTASILTSAEEANPYRAPRVDSGKRAERSIHPLLAGWWAIAWIALGMLMVTLALGALVWLARH